MLRRSRSFGLGAASKSAKNAAYDLGLTVKTVRSNSASSAARRAASRTKSVRFFPVRTAARSIRLRTSGWMRMFRVERALVTRIPYSTIT